MNFLRNVLVGRGSGGWVRCWVLVWVMWFYGCVLGVGVGCWLICASSRTIILALSCRGLGEVGVFARLGVWVGCPGWCPGWLSWLVALVGGLGWCFGLPWSFGECVECLVGDSLDESFFWGGLVGASLDAFMSDHQPVFVLVLPFVFAGDVSGGLLSASWTVGMCLCEIMFEGREILPFKHLMYL